MKPTRAEFNREALSVCAEWEELGGRLVACAMRERFVMSEKRQPFTERHWWDYEMARRGVKDVTPNG